MPIKFLTVVALVLSACISTPYKPSGDLYPNPNIDLKEEPQISRGEPNTIADGLGHYLFSLPEKLILWNWNMGRHSISPETEEAIKTYLAENELKEVKVRLNEYAPFEEWHRLVNNEGVGAGWRYTFGVVSWLFYTIFPGRIFGGDNFNPFTNTISLYSDLPIVAMHEGGHAKDFGEDEHKGSYAALRIIPFYNLRDEAVASSDALSYVHSHNDTDLEESGYKVLYPAYGTYVAGDFFSFIPGVRPLVGVIGAIPGHIVGRIRAAHVTDGENTDEKSKPPSEGSASSQQIE